MDTQGRSDLRVAKELLKLPHPPTDIICFHAQQAAEKLLKGYLTYKNVKTSRTHDISFLLELCIELDEDFSSLDIEALEGLTFYAVEVRYPDSFIYHPFRKQGKPCI